VEAEIPPDSAPPINARQGLLFEYVLLDFFPKRSTNQYGDSRWWSVFWVLFTAKSNGTGTDDAMVYTQVCGTRAATFLALYQP
jgi:hypothetical protein